MRLGPPHIAVGAPAQGMVQPSAAVAPPRVLPQTSGKLEHEDQREKGNRFLQHSAPYSRPAYSKSLQKAAHVAGVIVGLAVLAPVKERTATVSLLIVR